MDQKYRYEPYTSTPQQDRHAIPLPSCRTNQLNSVRHVFSQPLISPNKDKSSKSGDNIAVSSVRCRLPIRSSPARFTRPPRSIQPCQFASLASSCQACMKLPDLFSRSSDPLDPLIVCRNQRRTDGALSTVSERRPEGCLASRAPTRTTDPGTKRRVWACAGPPSLPISRTCG